MAGLTWADPGRFYAANVMLAAHLLDAVRASERHLRWCWRVGGRVWPCSGSSAARYRRHPCKPLTHNGISKHAQTLLGLAHARAGLRVLVARIFNPVGAGMPGRLALPSFAAAVARGRENLTVGNLDVARDFIHVADAVRLIDALATGRKSMGRFSIFVPAWPSLRRLVQDMVGLTGRQVRLEVSPALLRPGEMRTFRAVLPACLPPG